MRLVRDPTIRIFKTLNTAAVTTMVFQPTTAPGDAPENPRFEPQHRDSAPSGPNAACREEYRSGVLIPIISTKKSPCQHDRMTAPYPMIFHLNA